MDNSDPSYYECEWCKEWFPIPAALNHPDCPHYYLIKPRITKEASEQFNKFYVISASGISASASDIRVHIDNLIISEILNDKLSKKPVPPA